MPKTVAIVRGRNGKDLDDVRRMMKELFALIGSPSRLIPPGSRVLIKPNLTAEENCWERATVTGPFFVQALVELIKEAQPAEILIGEATAIGLNTRKAYTANGYDEVAAATGAKLVDLNEGEFVEIKTQSGGLLGSVRIARQVLEADFFLNAPVLKTHFFSTLTAAMKNLKGAIHSEEKKRFHYLDLNRAVAELNGVLKPHLTVVDGLIAQEGDGPIAGTPVGLNLLMAGTDAVALDTVAARIMGIDPAEVPPLRLARVMGYGELDEREIRVVGRSVEEVRRPFKRACAPLPTDLANLRFLDGQSCNACRDGVRVALDRLRQAGLLEGIPEIEISLGPQASPAFTSRVLMPVGNCQNQYKHLPHHVPGCPPPTFLIADQVREILGLERRFGPKKNFIMEEK